MTPLRPSELLLGPFRGFSIYPRALQALSPPLALAWVALAIAVLGLGLAGKRYLELSYALEEASDSPLRLIPRIHVDGTGQLRIEGPPGRRVDAGVFVLLLDDEATRPDFPPRELGDERPRVAVLQSGLWILKKDQQVPAVKTWAEVVASEGPLSMDGPELLHWMKGFLPRVVGTGWALVSALVLVYHLLFQGLLVALHQAILRRGPAGPKVGELFVLSSVAALPPLCVAACAAGLGLAQSQVLAVHALGLGALFLVAATKQRWDAEEGGRTQGTPEEGAPEVPGEAASDPS